MVNDSLAAIVPARMAVDRPAAIVRRQVMSSSPPTPAALVLAPIVGLTLGSMVGSSRMRRARLG